MKTPKILIVDSNIHDRLKIKDELVDINYGDGYEVREASDMASALEALKKEPDMSVVVCNLMEKKQDHGLHLLEQMRSEGFQQPFLFNTTCAYNPFPENWNEQYEKLSQDNQIFKTHCCDLTLDIVRSVREAVEFVQTQSAKQEPVRSPSIAPENFKRDDTPRSIP